MRTYDVTLTISPELPTWPGDPAVELERYSQIKNGDTANVSRVAMSVHAGTHVDAPFHFINDGKHVDELSLRVLIGRAYVVDLTGIDAIDAQVITNAGIPTRTKRVIFKTRNSEYWNNETPKFQKEYVAITPDGAQVLADRGVLLVGVDYLSVAPFDEPVATHEILLNAGIVVVEGLNLTQVSQGRYTLYCLPLKIAKCDGAPARVLLVGV